MLVEDTSRESAVEFMRLRGVIDCLVPRGGPSLIASILEHATVPYVIDGDGNCHVYVDAVGRPRHGPRHRRQRQGAAARACATPPRACSCTRRWPPAFLPRAAAALDGVELVGDAAARAARADGRGHRRRLRRRSSWPSSWPVRVVPVARRRHRPHQPVTAPATPRPSSPTTSRAADRFTSEVDAAAVLVNASTRFVDGEEFGFGAEIGISTQKLHARGPMGLRELTTLKYVVEGDGQIRG